MKVVANNSTAWFLLEDGGAYFLSARCSQSAVDFDVLVRLNPDEYREYHALGTLYLEYLAARINYWSKEYWPRNEVPQRSAADDAISVWSRGG